MAVQPDPTYPKKAFGPIINSHEEEEKTKGRGLRFITYFAESTSFMGISKMWACPRKTFKVMWTLFFLTASGVMIYQLVSLFEIFSSYPIKTSVKIGHQPLPLPSVSICNMNPIRLSQAKKLDCELQKALALDLDSQSEDCAETDDTFDYENYSITELVCDDDDNDDDDDDGSEGECYEEEVVGLDGVYIRRKRIAELLASESKSLRSEVGHDIKSMLVDCTVNGQICGVGNFTSFLSKDLGNCYTFDSGGLRVKKTGTEGGLSLVINIEPEEFIHSFTTGYGLRVVIHERGTIPFPGEEGFTVSAGAETSITMKMVDIERLPKPHGSCNQSEAFKQKFGVEYTEKACRAFCLWGVLLEKCGCQPDDMEREESTAKVCDEESEWTCLEKSIAKYYADTTKGIDVCRCGRPCKEIMYQTSVFSRNWPVHSHLLDLEDQVCEDDGNSPKCRYGDDLTDISVRISSFLKVKVYYESLNFENVKEEPFYNTERFLSDVGGTMGLWIGASVLSLAEFLEIFLELLCCCFYTKPK